MGLGHIGTDLSSRLHQATFGIQLAFIARLDIQSHQLIDRVAQIVFLLCQGLNLFSQGGAFRLSQAKRTPGLARLITQGGCLSKIIEQRHMALNIQ